MTNREPQARCHDTLPLFDPISMRRDGYSILSIASEPDQESYVVAPFDGRGRHTMADSTDDAGEHVTSGALPLKPRHLALYTSSMKERGKT